MKRRRIPNTPRHAPAWVAPFRHFGTLPDADDSQACLEFLGWLYKNDRIPGLPAMPDAPAAPVDEHGRISPELTPILIPEFAWLNDVDPDTGYRRSLFAGGRDAQGRTRDEWSRVRAARGGDGFFRRLRPNERR